jgi:chitodextrinase
MKSVQGRRGTARPIRSGRRLDAALAAVASVAGVTVATAVTAPASAGSAAVRDGSSSTLAAPSCWAIKQLNPSSASGVYWLQTAALVDPQQFYCDQTTDGGGWVLVGRGREGWTWNYNGQGSPADLRNTPSGTGGFAPDALSAPTINGLLDGGRVDALPDGIRLVRARNTSGSQLQEVRIKPSNRSVWTWSFGGGILFSQISFDGSTKGSGNTQSFTSDQNYNALVTPNSSAHNYRMGFGFGNRIAGSNSATSYLWSYTTEKNALPFTQVWLRPKLTSSSFTPVDAGGPPASTVRPLMSSQTSQTTPWGVTGIYGAVSELHMEVEAFAQIGNIMYVGGDFQYVQKGPNPGPGEKIQQSYVAGFDVNTGEWLSTFRPVLDGEVWDLQALPNGQLAIAGEFTSVDGQPNTTGIAAVDPTTGDVSTTWNAHVDYVNTAGTIAQVKAMDVQDGWLYIGGRFNRVSGGTTSQLNNVIVGRAARLRVSDGKPDGTWKPNFDGTVIELDASNQGDRVYFSGYFNNLNGSPSPNEAAVGTASPAAAVPGLAQWVPSIGSGTATYQQAIKEGTNGYVWQGGAEHILSQYNRSDYSRVSSNITKAGGDFQTIGIVDGVVYASCHCGDYTYSNDINYTSPIASASDVNNIKYIGAWDEKTGQYLAEFYPSALDTRSGIGGWALDGDSNGCLWFGGDFDQGSWTGSNYQWLGGFGKFCPRDTTAPSVPGSVKATTGSDGVTVNWSAATDNSGSVTYSVWRDDRVIGTTRGTSFVDPNATYPATYWVQAVDAEGNRSASGPGVTVSGPDVTPPSAPGQLTGSALSGASAQLDWGAATDDRGVAGYQVVRNGSVLPGLVAATTFTDTGLAPATDYTYTVRAVDAAGNVGPDSNPVAVTTPDVNPVVFQDSWTNPDGTAWQPAWSTSAATGSATTANNAGVLAVDDTAGAYSRAQLAGVDPRADSTVLMSYQWNAATAAAYLNVFLRGSGGWQSAYRPKTGYGLQLQSNSGTVTVQKNVNGTLTNIHSVTGGQAVTTAKQWLRLQVNGSTIQFRTWLDGQPEPATWKSVDTDSSVATSGQLFVSVVRAASNAGAKSVTLDDLRLYDA